MGWDGRGWAFFFVQDQTQPDKKEPAPKKQAEGPKLLFNLLPFLFLPVLEGCLKKNSSKIHRKQSTEGAG